MFAIVFEVRPREGRKDEYLALALALRPHLEATPGFLEVERFESRRRPGWVLSFSLWRDEKSVVRWRCQREHQKAQRRGRYELFVDYRLRVCEITADSHPRPDLPLLQQRLDETETGDAKALAVTELPPGHDATAQALRPERADGFLAQDLLESIYNPGKLLLLTSWRTAGQALAWEPGHVADGVRHRRARIVRDYGLLDRSEAPQYFPPVQEPAL